MSMRITVALLGLLAVCSGARAGGSITLDEVIEQLSDDNKLMTEIFDELHAQKMRAEDIVCTGSRFGRQWRLLGGARFIPYECQFGQRKLTIEGSMHLFDDDGKELDLDAADTPDRAAEFNQSDLRWTWK